jgi:hypothetical protein
MYGVPEKSAEYPAYGVDLNTFELNRAQSEGPVK